jgi:hypothetical protein
MRKLRLCEKRTSQSPLYPAVTLATAANSVGQAVPAAVFRPGPEQSSDGRKEPSLTLRVGRSNSLTRSESARTPAGRSNGSARSDWPAESEKRFSFPKPMAPPSFLCRSSGRGDRARISQGRDVGGERNKKPAGKTASRGLCCEFLSPESERHFAVRTFTASLKPYPRAGWYRRSNSEDCLISMFLFGNKTLKAWHLEKGSRASRAAEISRSGPTAGAET